MTTKLTLGTQMMMQSMNAQVRMNDVVRMLEDDPRVKRVSSDEFLMIDYGELEERIVGMFDNCEKLQKFEEALINLKAACRVLDNLLAYNAAYSGTMFNCMYIEWSILYNRAKKDQGWTSFSYIRKTPLNYDFWDLFDGAEDA